MAINIQTDEKVEVVVNSKSYSVKVPSLKSFSKLEKELKTIDPSKVADHYAAYFDSIGLPIAVTDEFTLKNWTQLIEEMTGSKKQ